MMRTLIVATLILFTCTAQGQNWQIRGIQHVSLTTKKPVNVWEGMEFSMFRHFTFNENMDIVGGISWTTNSWANHALIKLGATHEFAKHKNWSFSTQLAFGNGVALFTPSPLYTYDIQGLVYANYHTKKDNLWSIGIGLQFISTPGYRAYSTVYNSTTLPISLRYCF